MEYESQEIDGLRLQSVRYMRGVCECGWDVTGSKSYVHAGLIAHRKEAENLRLEDIVGQRDRDKRIRRHIRSMNGDRHPPSHIIESVRYMRGVCECGWDVTGSKSYVHAGLIAHRKEAENFRLEDIVGQRDREKRIRRHIRSMNGDRHPPSHIIELPERKWHAVCTCGWKLVDLEKRLKVAPDASPDEIITILENYHRGKCRDRYVYLVHCDDFLDSIWSTEAMAEKHVNDLKQAQAYGDPLRIDKWKVDTP